MRISDWSSDVCSSDLQETAGINRKRRLTGTLSPTGNCPAPRLMANPDPPPRRPEIEPPAKAATDARADQITDTNCPTGYTNSPPVTQTRRRIITRKQKHQHPAFAPLSMHPDPPYEP